MPSPETPLIGIPGEDNSPLTRIPDSGVSDFAFGLSPLRIPTSYPSSTPSGRGDGDGRVLNSALSIRNKEILNVENKSGMCNLSVERQKMKKSRKNGGYNLRKSLAWDRAFFTEEGVLDPEELSLISGLSHGNSLPAIDEERRESSTMVSDVDNGSAYIETTTTRRKPYSLETPKKKLVKELPSVHPNKTSTSSSTVKRDSLCGSRIPMVTRVTRSSQKVPTGRGLNKSALKVSDCSTPMTPSSQKRLLNTGTTKVTTRSSKIPRVPLSAHPTLPSITSIRAPDHLNCAEIAQPAQNSVSLKLPSNICSAYKGAKIRSGSTSKSIKKLGANTRMDMTCSSSEMDSSAKHIPRTTNKAGNYHQTYSKQNLPIKMAEPVDGTRSQVSSHPQSNNGDDKRKDVKVPGIKPSGLRMPSPSMKFFSEGNSKPSNPKSSIPTSRNTKPADHISEFKQIKVRNGSLYQNITSEIRLNPKVTEICSASSGDRISDGGEQCSISNSEQISSCTTKCRPIGVTDECADNEEGGVICDGELSTMRPGECSIQRDIISSDNVPDHENDNIFNEDRNSPIASMRCDTKEISDVGLMPNHSSTSFPEPSHNGSAEEPCLPAEHEIVDNGCQEVSSTFDGSEVTISTHVEVTQQVVNNDSIVKLPAERKDDIDLHKDTLPKDVSLERDGEENKIEKSDDVHEMHNSIGEVESQCDGVNANLVRSTDNLKVIIPPSNAVPFSDEWLAAIESVGEEILTMKTGAVQNSPPEKPVPEPSPWSPVKRKNNQAIGPFDCTKHTNAQPDNSE